MRSGEWQYTARDRVYRLEQVEPAAGWLPSHNCDSLRVEKGQKGNPTALSV